MKLLARPIFPLAVKLLQLRHTEASAIGEPNFYKSLNWSRCITHSLPNLRDMHDKTGLGKQGSQFEDTKSIAGNIDAAIDLRLGFHNLAPSCQDVHVKLRLVNIRGCAIVCCGHRLRN